MSTFDSAQHDRADDGTFAKMVTQESDAAILEQLGDIARNEPMGDQRRSTLRESHAGKRAAMMDPVTGGCDPVMVEDEDGRPRDVANLLSDELADHELEHFSHLPATGVRPAIADDVDRHEAAGGRVFVRNNHVGGQTVSWRPSGNDTSDFYYRIPSKKRDSSGGVFRQRPAVDVGEGDHSCARPRS